MSASVFKAWLFELPLRMQSVLACSMRGCDTSKKDDPSKFIVRAMRALVFNQADPTNSFIVSNGIPDDAHVKAFLNDLDSFPNHFIMHNMHAAEIIGYKHPDPEIRKWWTAFYQKMVKGFHLNYEREDQLDVRLGHTNVDPSQVTPPPPQPPVLQVAPPARVLVPMIQPESARDVLNPEPRKRVMQAPPKKARVVRVKKKKRWDAGTGTSHGNRDY